MSKLLCEEIAHRAGFIVSVGNWIAPDGRFIIGENYESHHWETIKKYLAYESEAENHLTWMNQKVQEGYIRLVFRSDVLFQVGCIKKEEIWDDAPNVKVMRDVLKRIPDIEIHIFSKTFYVIGYAKNILSRDWNRLQIKEEYEDTTQTRNRSDDIDS